ncbi:hypothetical protein GYMLUDRAFT_243872 [Collybiopsis luxurians FD-317 M1]|uniref:Uncharacterized protein n=1 Tax=Collybiopsis luxurians FD-317 M1 TaxID=944289 RepID=A0A0D0CY28_9AGAR|nr:hypothetical protein GYMLUDRAFT_243872 [Collybiopsis luxurians FD-317 M1]
MSSPSHRLLEEYNGISPLVNEELLHRFVDNYVRLPCRLLSDHGETIVVLASDGSEVLVQTNNTKCQTISPFTLYLEVLAKVCVIGQEKCLLAVRITNSGLNMDLQRINRIVKLIHTHPCGDEVFNISGQQTKQEELGAYTEALLSWPSEISTV